MFISNFLKKWILSTAVWKASTVPNMYYYGYSCQNCVSHRWPLQGRLCNNIKHLTIHVLITTYRLVWHYFSIRLRNFYSEIQLSWFPVDGYLDSREAHSFLLQSSLVWTTSLDYRTQNLSDLLMIYLDILVFCFPLLRQLRHIWNTRNILTQLILSYSAVWEILHILVQTVVEVLSTYSYHVIQYFII
jgi:hypothetical protein